MKNKLYILLYAFIAQLVFFAVMIVSYELVNNSSIIFILHLVMLVGLYIYLIMNKEKIIKNTRNSKNKFLLKFYGYFALSFIILIVLTSLLKNLNILFVCDYSLCDAVINFYMLMVFPIMEVLITLICVVAKYGYSSIKEKKALRFSWLLVLFILLVCLLLFILRLFI